MVPRQPHSVRTDRLHLGKWIAIGLVALPVAEFVAFIVVATLIGVGAALALMILTSLAGAMVLRHVGRSGIAQFRVAVAERDVTEGPGLGAALGGILLILPGFITDVVGALLLLPWVRRWLGATFRRARSVPGERPGRAGVVDLAPSEWRQVDDAESANSRSAKTRDRIEKH